MTSRPDEAKRRAHRIASGKPPTGSRTFPGSRVELVLAWRTILIRSDLTLVTTMSCLQSNPSRSGAQQAVQSCTAATESGTQRRRQSPLRIAIPPDADSPRAPLRTS
jgi:hypothetical protein